MGISLFIYLTVFFVSAVFAYFYQYMLERQRFVKNSNCSFIIYKSLVYSLFILLLLPVVFLGTFRFGVGTDYFSYKDDFIHYSNLSILEIMRGKLEIGYNLLNLFASKISNHYGSVLFLNIILTLVPVIYVAKKENNNYLPLSLLIFYMILLPSSLNGMRQAIAVSFTLIALHLLLKGRNIKFILMILIASLFHQSSLICLGYLFLKINDKGNIQKKVVFRILCIFALICSINIVVKMFEFLPVLGRYMIKYNDTAGYLSLNHYIVHVFLRLPIVLPVLFLTPKLIKKDINNCTFLLLPLCEFIFLIMSISNKWAMRLTYYPMIGQVILIPRIINSFNNRRDRVAMVIYFLTFYMAQFLILFMYYRYDNIFPFEWIKGIL